MNLRHQHKNYGDAPPFPLAQSSPILLNFYQDTLTSSSYMDSLEESLNEAMSG